MSVHYKFKSALSYDTITFDGLHISVKDLKRAILQQKQIGKATDFDLQITNAQSNEVYTDDGALIPKNSSLIVVRIPLTAQQKKAWEKSDPSQGPGGKSSGIGDFQDPLVSRLAKVVDLSSIDASEEDKIQAAMMQSTLDYDPANYPRIKGSNQVGDLPPNYRCYKCLQPGHWIKDCKLNSQQDAVEIKKSTGIPRSFMVPVEGPAVPGAMMTPSGQFAVPSIEHEARKEPPRKPLDPQALEKPTIPQDLVCGVCKDLLSDAVMIPCCGNSFCDECIRNVLLESEDHQCPDCKEKDVSPDTLIPNRFLRNSVNNFKNQTGYIRAVIAAPPPKLVPPPPVVQEGKKLKKIDEPPLPVSPPVAVVTPLSLPIVPTLVTLGNEGGGKGEGKVEEKNKQDETTRQAMGIPIPSPVPVTTPAGMSKEGALGGVRPGLLHPQLTPQVLAPGPTPIPTIGSSKPTNLKVVMHHNSGHHHRRSPPSQPQQHPPQGLPIRTIAIHHPRMKQQEEPRRDKPPQYSRRDVYSSHHERSGTPTVDERNLPAEPPQGYPLGPLAPPPRILMAMNHPPPQPYPPEMHHERRGGYLMGGELGYGMPREGPFPGLEERHFRPGPHFRPRPRLQQYRPHSPQNGTVIPSGPIDDPWEAFQRMMREKDSDRRRRRRSRSYTPRSLSRSSSRGRSRTPRSPRSRSRSPPPKRRNTRSRSRSRSFSISRSASRSSRSASRERRPSPRRHRPSPSHRSPLPRYNSSPRYYSRYPKEEGLRSSGSSGYGSGRPLRRPPPREYYPQQEYSRYNEPGRYETSKYISGQRERERSSYKRYEESETPRYEDYSVRELAAKDWERIRDKEIEQRERERQYEYYSTAASRRSESRERHRKPKQHTVDIVETPREERVLEENRDRVLVEVKREPSREKTPEKKIKEKKKKKKDDPDKKKKKKEKKVKEKKDQPENLLAAPPAKDIEEPPKPEVKEEVKDELYGGLEVPIDQNVVENYSKVPEPKEIMLAPLPELSKWEKEEEPLSLVEEKPGTVAGSTEEGKRVTSEVIKRAENAIFKKSSNPIKPIEKKNEKKPNSGERREPPSTSDRREKEQVMDRKEKEPPPQERREKEQLAERREKEQVPERREKKEEQPAQPERREREKEAPKSVALKPEQTDQKAKSKVEKPKIQPEKPSPVRISAKERLGAKVEDKVVVKRDLKLSKREIKIEKVPKSVVHKEKRVEPSRERKKTPLDESTFEPDYETSDIEERRIVKKRSATPEKPTNGKRPRLEGMESEDSSGSSDDSDRKHKKRKKSKKKKNKKKCKRKHETSSDSDSSSSSSGSDSEKRKKRHKHKSHKKSKKRKKSKK